VEVLIPDFLPSNAGFRFANSFPRVPVRRIGIPGVLSIPIGDASNGLCGGMAFAARDYFESDRPLPEDSTPPGESSPLFRYIVDRLFDSFDLPVGPTRYLELMNPAIPDSDSVLAQIGIGPHGRAWRMIREEWPKVRADIDGGHPSALGLVRVKSLNPLDLKMNHQVLAYGYQTADGSLTLRIYDPNRPGDDDLTLSLQMSDPRRPSAIRSTLPGNPVLSFFRVDYRPKQPPSSA
jgi:hypothetical protein